HVGILEMVPRLSPSTIRMRTDSVTLQAGTASSGSVVSAQGEEPMAVDIQDSDGLMVHPGITLPGRAGNQATASEMRNAFARLIEVAMAGMTYIVETDTLVFARKMLRFLLVSALFAVALAQDQCFCGSGPWAYFRNYCYTKTSGSRYNWDEFVRTCRDLGDGAQAVSIHNSNENRFSHATGGNSKFWIGGQCTRGRTHGGRHPGFRWVDGSRFSFTAWKSGEPSNSFGNEECICQADRGGDGWNDVHCRDRHAGVCKKRARQRC
ncbi:unnamed protein product, partial [Owenia fusiformis]